MNRRTEYEAMIAELNTWAPELDTSLERAYKKRRIKTAKSVLHSATGLAACFTVFVLLVNFCTPVAYACSLVPGLRELAAAVKFSQSLSDAVENAYVQPMDLSQTENGITAKIEYLIVDQKQVNIFYRLESDQYQQLAVDPDIKCEDDDTGFCVLNNSFNEDNGELLSVMVDFTNGNVPDHLQYTLRIYSNYVDYSEAPANQITDEIYSDDVYDRPGYLAEMTFDLKFDPPFTAAGKRFPVNQTVILDGQAITVTNIEVYPTHMRVEIAESADNTAWLKSLDFYIESDWGMKFNPVSSGITATGSETSPSMVSYRADSTYFYEAKHLKLVITGAKWLRKDMETTWLNLVTGEHGALPEGAEFDSARKEGGYWVVKFRAAYEENKPMYQLFGHEFYDADGNAYEINMWSGMYGDPDENGNITYFYDEFPLKNYAFDEVWLSPQYSHYWTAEKAVMISVK